MADSVQSYLDQKKFETASGNEQVTNDSGLNTVLNALLTPFRWGNEAMTAALIKAQNDYLDWDKAYSIATGDRKGKAWWESGEGKVTTLGQAFTNAFTGDVQYDKLKTYDAERFSTGPRKYLSGGIDLIASVFLDPLNFFSAGTLGAAAKAAALMPAGFKGIKLLNITSDSVLTASKYDRVTDFFSTAQRAVNAGGTFPEGSIIRGTTQYDNALTQLKPHFKAFDDNFAEDVTPLPDSSASYFDAGVSSYAISDNKLHRWNDEAKAWDVEEVISDGVFGATTFDSELINAPRYYGSYGFTSYPQDSVIRQIPIFEDNLGVLPEGAMFGWVKAGPEATGYRQVAIVPQKNGIPDVYGLARVDELTSPNAMRSELSNYTFESAKYMALQSAKQFGDFNRGATYLVSNLDDEAMAIVKQLQERKLHVIQDISPQEVYVVEKGGKISRATLDGDKVVFTELKKPTLSGNFEEIDKELIRLNSTDDITRTELWLSNVDEQVIERESVRAIEGKQLNDLQDFEDAFANNPNITELKDQVDAYGDTPNYMDDLEETGFVDEVDDPNWLPEDKETAKKDPISFDEEIIDYNDDTLRWVRITPDELEGYFKSYRMEHVNMFGVKQYVEVPANLALTARPILVKDLGGKQVSLPIFVDENGVRYSIGIDNKVKPIKEVKTEVARHTAAKKEVSRQAAYGISTWVDDVMRRNKRYQQLANQVTEGLSVDDINRMRLEKVEYLRKMWMNLDKDKLALAEKAFKPRYDDTGNFIGFDEPDTLNNLIMSVVGGNIDAKLTPEIKKLQDALDEFKLKLRLEMQGKMYSREYDVALQEDTIIKNTFDDAQLDDAVQASIDKEGLSIYAQEAIDMQDIAMKREAGTYKRPVELQFGWTMRDVERDGTAYKVLEFNMNVVQKEGFGSTLDGAKVIEEKPILLKRWAIPESAWSDLAYLKSHLDGRTAPRMANKNPVNPLSSFEGRISKNKFFDNFEIKNGEYPFYISIDEAGQVGLTRRSGNFVPSYEKEKELVNKAINDWLNAQATYPIDPAIEARYKDAMRRLPYLTDSDSYDVARLYGDYPPRPRTVSWSEAGVFNLFDDLNQTKFAEYAVGESELLSMVDTQAEGIAAWLKRVAEDREYAAAGSKVFIPYKERMLIEKERKSLAMATAEKRRIEAENFEKNYGIPEDAVPIGPASEADSVGDVNSVNQKEAQ